MHHQVKNTTPRVIYRWVSGRALDGQLRTDSSWLHPATKVLTPTGRASRWAKLPGWKRQLWRHGITTTTLVTGYGAIVEPVWTGAGWGTAVTTGAGVGVYKAKRAWDIRKHTREWVTPLARELGWELYGERVPPPGWLTVPLDFHDEGEVRVELPRHLPDARRIEILGLVRDKLGLAEEVTSVWNFRGQNAHLVVRKLPRPPKSVKLADVRDLLLSAKESAPILGLGRRSKAVSVDLDTESPHVLINAGSGGGKSVQTRAIVAQLMRNGAQATFLDVKRQSHRWARDLPGVSYCRDPHEIHDKLIDLAEEGERRNRLADSVPFGGDDSALDLGPRLVLVCEEMNAMIGRLQAYWMEIKGSKDPKQSPAVKALHEILFMGRQVKIHVVAIGQMMTAKTLGGPEARENFAVRIMTRYSVNAWKMLAPEVWPAPRSSRHPGRAQVVSGGEATETQVLFMTEEEARDWASSGPVTIPVEWAETRNTVKHTEPELVFHADRVSPLPLREIAERGLVPMSYAGLRTAKHREPATFPKPVPRPHGGVELYRPSDITAWFETSGRALAKESS